MSCGIKEVFDQLHSIINSSSDSADVSLQSLPKIDVLMEVLLVQKFGTNTKSVDGQLCSKYSINFAKYIFNIC